MSTVLWGSFGGQGRLDRIMWESLRIEIPVVGCTSCPGEDLGKFCLSALRSLMGRTEGNNGSFLAIRMKIHRNLSSSLTPSCTQKKIKKGQDYAQISDWYMHMWYICYCYCNAGNSFGALMYLRAKTLKNVHHRIFLQLLQKVQVSGWFFGLCILSQICNIEVTTFGRFYKLAQICGICGQIFFLACRHLQMKGQHDFIRQFKKLCDVPRI